MSSLRQLCDALDAAPDASVPSLLKQADLPDELRRGLGIYRRASWAAGGKAQAEREGGPLARWLWELFEGVENPRLAVLRWAFLQFHAEDLQWKTDWKQLALEYGRRLDANFQPPELFGNVIEERDPNGEKKIQRMGDERRGVVHTEYSLEHAADSTYGVVYELDGLSPGAAVTIDVSERRGIYTHKLAISGSVPTVFTLALDWAARCANSHRPF